MSDLAWASGFFEGEGCLGIYDNGRGRFYLRAEVSNTDEDSLRRFMTAVGIGRLYGPYQKGKPSDKAVFVWQAPGFEKTQAVIAMLWSGLGERRRIKARQILHDMRGR